MLAQNSESINDASATVYKLTKEEENRLKREAREDYYRRERSNRHMYEKVCREKEALEKTLAELNAALAERDATLAELDVALAERDATLAELQVALAELDMKQVNTETS